MPRRRRNGRYGEEVVAWKGIPHTAESAELARLERLREKGESMLADDDLSSSYVRSVPAVRGSVSMTLAVRTLDELSKLVLVLGENRGRVVDRAVNELASRVLEEERKKRDANRQS